jgi:hypothetical protein
MGGDWLRQGPMGRISENKIITLTMLTASLMTGAKFVGPESVIPGVISMYREITSPNVLHGRLSG